MMESIEGFFIPEGQNTDCERGQILLLLALAMVGLLVAAGLATDGGVLFMRRAQLERAVDASALAGVVLLDGVDWPELAEANTRGQQVLAANTFETSDPGPNQADFNNDVDCTLDDYDYCGKAENGYLPGTIRYTVEAETQAEVYFMRLVGFDTIPLRSTATAEYQPLVDIFASEALQTGEMRSSNQSVFGPDGCTSFGDPYSPTGSNPWYDELNGSYNYRIRIPESYVYNADSSVNHDRVRIELFDPDTSNASQSNYTIYDSEGNTESASCTDPQGRAQPCLFDVSESGAEQPFWWFARIDENRWGNGSGSGCYTPSYSPSQNTRTEFRLYYLKQNTDGSLEEVELAYYIGERDDSSGEDEAEATDMHWISPGASCPGPDDNPTYTDSDCELMPEFSAADVFPSGGGTTVSDGEPRTTVVDDCATYVNDNYPGEGRTCTDDSDGDFIIQLIDNAGRDTEVKDIYVDPATGHRDLFLDVTTIAGASENGYEIWAGPPRTDGSNWEAPSYVNARQMFIVNHPGLHNSDGVGVYGIGHLPMNSNVDNRVDIPLAYLGPEFGGLTLTVSLFDPDSQHDPPISFWFEGIPRKDWTACFGEQDKDCDDPLPDGPGGDKDHYLGPSNTENGQANNQWRDLEFDIPAELSSGLGGTPFYGGILYVSYDGGRTDTYGWKIAIESRPYLIQ